MKHKPICIKIPHIMERLEAAKLPQIKFLLVRHHPEDVNTVWDAAKDSQIIMLESIGMPDVLRQDFLRDATSVSGTNGSLLRLLGSLELSWKYPNADPFWKGIVSKAVRSQKELFLIDSNDRHIGYLNTIAAEEKFKEAGSEWDMGNVRQAYENYAIYYDLVAEGVIQRDKLSLSQIENILLENRSWAGKKIAIIQGQTHSKVSIDFKKRNPEYGTKRQFTKLIPGGFFTLMHEYKNRKLLGENRATLEPIIQRGFVTEFLIYPSLNVYTSNEHRQMDMAAVIVRLISDEEIWESLEKVFSLEKNWNNNLSFAKGHYVDFYSKRIGNELVNKYWKRAMTTKTKTNMSFVPR